MKKYAFCVIFWTNHVYQQEEYGLLCSIAESSPVNLPPTPAGFLFGLIFNYKDRTRHGYYRENFISNIKQ
jgi:hypothetical protein